MKNADYRKINDRTQNSSTYHKKDGTNVRAVLKEESRKEIDEDETLDYIDTTMKDAIEFEEDE